VIPFCVLSQAIAKSARLAPPAVKSKKMVGPIFHFFIRSLHNAFFLHATIGIVNFA
jgi:hypothetical protein